MEESVTLLQLLAGSGLSLATVVGAWVAINSKVSKMETDIEYLKKEDEKVAESIREIRAENQVAYRNLYVKLDSLFVSLNEIKIELQNKKNRNEN